MGILKYSHNAVEAKTRASVAEVKVVEVEEATKVAKGKPEEALFEAYKEIKSLKAKARVAKCEALDARD